MISTMGTKDAQILIKNVAGDVTEEMIRERFMKYGNIVDIFMNRDMVMIDYDQVESAVNAIVGEDKKLLRGKVLEIDMLTANPTTDPPVDDIEMAAIHSTTGNRGAEATAPEDETGAWSAEWRQRHELHAPPDERTWGGGRGSGRRSGGASYRDRSPLREGLPEDGNNFHEVGASGRLNAVEIIVVANPQRAYAERIEQKFMELRVKVNMFIAEPTLIPVPAMLSELTAIGTPFAILVDNNSDKRDAVTLYKLQDDPKEWKNIPVKEAISIVLIGLAPAELVPARHPSFVYRNLYRLGDNRALSTQDYDALISYLADERDRTAEKISETRLAEEAVRSAVRALNQSGDRNKGELEDQIINIVNQFRNVIESDASFEDTLQDLLGGE